MNNSSGVENLRVTIHLRDNTAKEFSENVQNGSGDNIDLKILSQKLLSLQTKVNNCLTELVEQERETTRLANTEQQIDDEDEDEEDDEEEDINEPPTKQQKT